MIKKKLVEKDVEVVKTIIEKRLVEIYCFEDKDYHNVCDLKDVIATRMAGVYEKVLDYSTRRCNLVSHTGMATLQNNMRGSWGGARIFAGDEMFEYFEEIKELKSIYSQLDD